MKCLKILAGLSLAGSLGGLFYLGKCFAEGFRRDG